MAGLQSIGGIPNRTTLCPGEPSGLNPIGGGADNSTNINNAINACPAGDVLQLNAGTFQVANGNNIALNKGITLRGAGAGSTIIARSVNGATLANPGCSTCSPQMIVGPEEWNGGTGSSATNLLVDGAQGALTVQVASISGFSTTLGAIGNIVMVDEASGLGWQYDWVTGTQVWSAPDYRITWKAHNPALAGDEGLPIPNYGYYGETDRYTSEIKHIVAVNAAGSGGCTASSGGCLTFDSPLTISYRVSHTAHVVSFQTAWTLYAGVENMTIENGNYSNLWFQWCMYCWAKNVETTLHNQGGIWISNGLRDQIEGAYVHQSANPNYGGGGYNFQIDGGSTEILIENSIDLLADKVIVARNAGAGSVIAYNYFDMQECVNCGDAWVEDGMGASHWLGSHHVLFEGNWTSNWDSDDTWGSAPYMTFFRNYASGFRSRFTDAVTSVVVDDANNLPGGNGPLRAAGSAWYHYWQSFIGNVLGTPGKTTAANGWSHLTTTCGATGIYNLGWACGSVPNGGGDMEVSGQKSPVPAACVSGTGDPCPDINHGNYDYLANSVTWSPSISDHTLPNSFYLSSAPSFFSAGASCTYPWPWVTPTGSSQIQANSCGGDGLPAKARYDAGTPFKQP